MIIVKKYDGRETIFDGEKIQIAILKASTACFEFIPEDKIKSIIVNIKEYADRKGTVHVEEIHNLVELQLIEKGYKETSECYKLYRKERAKVRDSKSDLMKALNKITATDDRGAGSNANVGNNFSAKLLKLASEANKVKNLANMPKKFARRHECGDWHIHDLDSYDLAPNCLQVQTGEALAKGFNPGYGYIRPAKRLSTAAILSCILLQGSQNLF